MSELTTTEQLNKTKQFIKEAFCVDGSVDFLPAPVTFDSCFRLTDSKRGVIIVAFKGGDPSTDSIEGSEG